MEKGIKIMGYINTTKSDEPINFFSDAEIKSWSFDDVVALTGYHNENTTEDLKRVFSLRLEPFLVNENVRSVTVFSLLAHLIHNPKADDGEFLETIVSTPIVQKHLLNDSPLAGFQSFVTTIVKTRSLNAATLRMLAEYRNVITETHVAHHKNVTLETIEHIFFNGTERGKQNAAIKLYLHPENADWPSEWLEERYGLPFQKLYGARAEANTTPTGR